jgi:hypothetical protein
MSSNNGSFLELVNGIEGKGNSFSTVLLIATIKEVANKEAKIRSIG